MDADFVVYLHFVQGEELPFYVGEGRERRSRSRANRNRWWNAKVEKHGGFRVEIESRGLTKDEAQDRERELIRQYRANGVPLVNICEGPAFEKHWLLGAPREMHPMYGRKRVMPEVAESNRRRLGSRLKPRPDLADRNRAQDFCRYKRPIRCIETGEVFESIVAAARSVGVDDSKVNRALKNGGRSGGFHWEYVTSRR